MSFILKKYQRRVLARLEAFLEECKLADIADAYAKVARHKDAEGNPENRYATEYKVTGGLDNCPHVCLRVPTGGGKTYLAALSLRPIARYRETDAPTVLWFTPSDTIRKQTVTMLNNPDHPCRIALGEMFGNMLQICDVNDFANLRPQDFELHTTIIVSTAQMFRVRQTARNVDGMTIATRKIYETNEALEPHFARFCPPNPPQELMRDDKGEVLLSFANLMYLLRPAVILDEAHNFVSELSQEVLRRINPACVVEWTATPREKDGEPLHNVLASAGAEELRDEQMIKMPVRLTSHSGWENAVNGAVNERKRLANVARESGDVVRPIVLYKAQDKSDEVTPKRLKQHLIDDNGIAENTIAIATGEIKDLVDINLLAADCPIEHIITVEALREGWDCSYAYLLCVIDNMRSTTAVEQLLGRVLRMPFAEKRKHTELNCAYAHVAADNFVDAVRAMREKIATGLGFEEDEIREFLQQSDIPIVVVDDITQIERGVGGILRLEHTPDFSTLPEDERAEAHVSVEFCVSKEGDDTSGVPVRLIKPITPAMQDALVRATAEDKRAQQTQKINQANAALSANRPPAERGEPFAPLMQMSFILPDENKRDLVDESSLFQAAEWNNLSDDCVLSNFSIREDANTFTIELQDGRVRQTQIDGYHISPAFDESVALDKPTLSRWLQNEIRAPDARYFPSMLQTLVDSNIEHLLAQDNNLAQLTRAKYLLAKSLKDWLKAHEAEVIDETNRRMLFGNDELRCDRVFEFPYNYPAGKTYSGAHQFNNHYYRQIGKFDSPEEEDCAILLDGMSEVKHWVRNIASGIYSFKLPSQPDMFYPDFVAELTNGKLLVVEYKGKGFWDGSKFDREIGKLWERKSDGNQFFIMVSPQSDKPDVDTQLRNKIASIM